MAKIYGLFGSMTGKVADVVMAVRNGEQIARKYQPVVSNPNTSAQVAGRAKLKLMSQLSAIMAPVIAIPRSGSVSSRNLFVKRNYQLATYNNNEASVGYEGIQLTKSVLSFPVIGATRQEASIKAYINTAVPIGTLDISRVVYAMFEKQNDNTLRLAGTAVVNNEGSGDWAASDLPIVNGPVVIYAYGVRDNTESARVIFGNLQAPTAEAVVKLIVSRTLTETDISMTETRSYSLPAAQA